MLLPDYVNFNDPKHHDYECENCSEQPGRNLKYIRDVYRKDREQKGFFVLFFDDLLTENTSRKSISKHHHCIFVFIAISVLEYLDGCFLDQPSHQRNCVRKVNGATVSGKFWSS